MSDSQAAPIVVSAQEYKHQQAVKAMEEAATKNSDETVAGGRYKRGDVFVNANGDVIADAAKAK